MTNYNERLDDAVSLIGIPLPIEQAIHAKDTAKQAITSLIKELVADAKPAKKDQLAQSTNEDESRCRFYRYGGYNFAIDEFEQNLLKVLEEV